MKKIHIERLKLLALAEHLELTELQARQAIESGKFSIYCKAEEKSLSEFMRRFVIDTSKKLQINYKGNDFVIVEEVGSE